MYLMFRLEPEGLQLKAAGHKTGDNFSSPGLQNVLGTLVSQHMSHLTLERGCSSASLFYHGCSIEPTRLPQPHIISHIWSQVQVFCKFFGRHSTPSSPPSSPGATDNQKVSSVKTCVQGKLPSPRACKLEVEALLLLFSPSLLETELVRVRIGCRCNLGRDFDSENQK